MNMNAKTACNRFRADCFGNAGHFQWQHAQRVADSDPAPCFERLGLAAAVATPGEAETRESAAKPCPTCFLRFTDQKAAGWLHFLILRAFFGTKPGCGAVAEQKIL